MIDDFTIFSRNGLILFRKSFVRLRGAPLVHLVENVLLQDRAAQKSASVDGYTLRWALANDIGLVFALVYQTSLPPAYADELLASVRKDFSGRVRDGGEDGAGDGFEDVFEMLLRRAEDSSLKSAAEARGRPRGKAVVEKFGEEEEEEEMDSEKLEKNREAFRKRMGSGGKGKGKEKADGGKTEVEGKRGKGKGKPKRSSGKITNEEVEGLDFSADKPSEAVAGEAELRRFREQFLDAPANTGYTLIEEEGKESEEETIGGGVMDYFKGLAGMKDLERKDIDASLDKFREALVGKNVATEIADGLIESVASSLEGQRMESMTSVTATVRKALDEALTRILTPRQSVDILGEISAKKARGGGPFVITMCGVNGVGKSTSLAKICYYLVNNGYRVMIAACDTFRAGAVEQLRTHVRCLGENVELFDRGYGKDAAGVAQDAARRAKDLGYDVVLVDTAGRMQDNEPLMRALSKLVELNQPDRLFFVGEALVGNDAVDQLSKFNRALEDNQKSKKPRCIDGIILTKFDTVDDKVGAAVSMVYETGQPIVFVGVGQTYMDLRKVNTRSLVKALLK